MVLDAFVFFKDVFLFWSARGSAVQITDYDKRLPWTSLPSSIIFSLIHYFLRDINSNVLYHLT